MLIAHLVKLVYRVQDESGAARFAANAIELNVPILLNCRERTYAL